MKTGLLTAVMTLLPQVASAQVQVSVAVPTVQVEVGGPQGAAPGPDYVWEPARWVMQNGTWVHQPGYWRQVAPPPPVAYQPEYQGYPAAGEVIVDEPPPAPIVEVRPAVPYVNAVWIPGFWRYHNHRHYWNRGYYTRPRDGYSYEAVRWERHGNRWACRGGGWHRSDDRGYYRGGRDDDRGYNRGGRDDNRYRWGHRGHHH